ncbi:uncharacterized protein LOC110406220, partial [Numida meleagris]|uniref:uncharacterized protein LOC110406220 n=1 Tax=Numida meleagris TaxID=8996 RepID=UPI000B3E2620
SLRLSAHRSGYATPIAAVATGAPHGSARPVGAFPPGLRPSGGTGTGTGTGTATGSGAGPSPAGGAASPHADAEDRPRGSRGSPRGRCRAVSRATAGTTRGTGAVRPRAGQVLRRTGLSCRRAARELALRHAGCVPFAPLFYFIFCGDGNAPTLVCDWWPADGGPVPLRGAGGGTCACSAPAAPLPARSGAAPRGRRAPSAPWQPGAPRCIRAGGKERSPSRCRTSAA